MARSFVLASRFQSVGDYDHHYTLGAVAGFKINAKIPALWSMIKDRQSIIFSFQIFYCFIWALIFAIRFTWLYFIILYNWLNWVGVIIPGNINNPCFNKPKFILLSEVDCTVAVFLHRIADCYRAVAENNTGIQYSLIQMLTAGTTMKIAREKSVSQNTHTMSYRWNRRIMMPSPTQHWTDMLK